MARMLLDTDMYSEVFRGRNVRVTARLAAYRNEVGRLTLSSISVMEMVEGFHRAGRVERLQAFLDDLSKEEHLPFDFQSAQIAGAIIAKLRIAGKTIGVFDPMIAAIALQHSLTLVTGNTEHYRRIQEIGYDLKLENWRE